MKLYGMVGKPLSDLAPGYREAFLNRCSLLLSFCCRRCCAASSDVNIRHRQGSPLNGASCFRLLCCQGSKS